jgi:hypothetical protein
MRQLSLRLPDDLWAALKAYAAREGRSMHSQILVILRHYLEEKGYLKPQD